ncbi:MAG: AAA family ATPase, partial [Mycobacteriales bacterium]
LLVAVVSALPPRSAVGLSGLCGAGKTTLAAALTAALPRVAVVAADDFLDPAGCTVVTDDWSGLERLRLRDQVVEPFRQGAPVRWQRRDWDHGLVEWHDLPPCEVLVVEGVGVLHPSLAWDLTVWLDAAPSLALARGIARDRGRYDDHERLWREVWTPTDLAYVARFRPGATADLVLRSSSATEAPLT